MFIREVQNKKCASAHLNVAPNDDRVRPMASSIYVKAVDCNQSLPAVQNKLSAKKNVIS